MRVFPRRRIRQVLAVVALFGFATTSPGLSGLEVVAHLAGLVDLTHARQPHFEGAGQSGHTDECQLGRAPLSGRPTQVGAPAVGQLATPTLLPARPAEVPFARAVPATALPRAPPA